MSLTLGMGHITPGLREEVRGLLLIIQGYPLKNAGHSAILHLPMCLVAAQASGCSGLYLLLLFWCINIIFHAIYLYLFIYFVSILFYMCILCCV